MKWIPVLCLSTGLAGVVLMWQTGGFPLRNTGVPAPATRRENTLLASHRTIFAAGIVEGASREVPLNFEVTGRLVSLDVAEGDSVSQGQILARQDSVLLLQQLAAAEAQLEFARAERDRLVNGAREETRQLARTEAELAAVRVDQADADYQRAAAVYKQHAISDQQFDDARFRLRIARVQWELARARLAEIEAAARPDELKMAEAKIQTGLAEVQQTRTMLDKAVLRAPCDGVVLDIDTEPGELVGPERPGPIITLVDDRRIRVRAWVEELDVLSLRIGQAASVTADGMPDTTFTGPITWIAPSMQPKRHRHYKPGERLDINVREILIQLDDPGPLVIGLPVDVSIEPAEPETPQSPIAVPATVGHPQSGHPR